ncbi:MAG: glycosyltransferase involved in cell wall biosynthesis [Candidatus Omnitrophota bacterium]|jgi:glycosyltransferase involved in cell wall biosynthesis
MEKQKTKISLIIPFFNEAELIPAAYTHFLKCDADELIWVDGGSTDNSIGLIQPHCNQTNIRLIHHNKAQRASQMNAGAEVATGDILIFCHIDMCLPLEWKAEVLRIINLGYRIGGFMKTYDTHSWLMKIYAHCLNHIYYTLFKNIVGTNAIFITRDEFIKSGGYPKISFLEDLIYITNIKKTNKLGLSHAKVKVSGRRYSKVGALSQIWLNLRILLAYKCGQNPEQLQRLYTKNQPKKPQFVVS